MNRSWLMVIIAGMIEVAWATGLKYANSWYALAATLALIALSFYVLMLATQNIPVATVYAVFTGIGTAGTVIVEIALFGEPFHWQKIGFILLLLAGVIGLKRVTADPAETASGGKGAA